MTETYETVRFRGRSTLVPAVKVNDTVVIVSGRWLKTAMIKDEDVIEGSPVSNPEAWIAQLSKTSNADLFCFAQKPTDNQPHYRFQMVWDNAAIIPLKGYDDWWEKTLSQETRRNVRRAAKSGVTVRIIDFDDELVRQIVEIYNESPIRQGRRFDHYGKGFDELREETGTYLNRSIFIGAYYKEELIGFCKMICADRTANIIHILCKSKHADKRPSNALMAKAVEICAERGMSHLAYCKYVYGNNNQSTLTEFKRRNGFEQRLYPRYYVALSAKGRIALALGMHLGIRSILPRALVVNLVRFRARLFQIVHRHSLEKAA